MTRQYRHAELAAMPDRKLWDLMAAYNSLGKETRHKVTRVICADMVNNIDLILNHRGEAKRDHHVQITFRSLN